MTLQPLCTLGVSEQAGFSKDQFENLIDTIPDSDLRKHVAGLYEDKNYHDLETSLVHYLEEYMESSFKGEEREVIERKKENIIDGVIDFIENADSERIEDIDSFEDKDKEESSFADTEVMMTTTPTEAQVANATSQMVKLIEEDVMQDKKAKAKSLLEKKDYDALEDFVLDNLDQSELTDFGDEQGTNILNTLSLAMDVLHASTGTVPAAVKNSTMLQDENSLEALMVTDSLDNEEEMLSILRDSISKTEEEIEEFISRLNENEED